MPICRMATTELQKDWYFAKQNFLKRGVGASIRWKSGTPVPLDK